MERRKFLRAAATVLPAVAGIATPVPSSAQNGVPSLPKPLIGGGKPLMSALAERRTSRSLAERSLSPQMLSNLLWAAFGVNRSEGNLRTAPSAVNVQEIDLYVFLAGGVYLFDAASHSLKPVLSGDHRGATGSQPEVDKAPVSFVYVADLRKYTARSAMRITDPAQQLAWSNAHAGFIGQNVYLFAASEGLGAWFRALIDGPAIAKLLKLDQSQKVLYAQTVGYLATA